VPTTTTSGQVKRGKSVRRNTELIGLRINKGLSRDDLAAKAQVGRETIRLAERGFVPGPRVQFAIARSLDVLPLDIWPIERQRGVR
jgi:DNA-binding XRE family transcriptional regulator